MLSGDEVLAKTQRMYCKSSTVYFGNEEFQDRRMAPDNRILTVESTIHGSEVSCLPAALSNQSKRDLTVHTEMERCRYQLDAAE